MTDTLKPCPFCGGTDIREHGINDIAADDQYKTYKQCYDCNACGPDDCEGLNWNTRAESQPDYCDSHCTWLDHAPGCERAESSGPLPLARHSRDLPVTPTGHGHLAGDKPAPTASAGVVAVQACRPEDRAMLATPAGAELVAGTVHLAVVRLGGRLA